jgi:quinol monooxygenase YgiN
MAESEQLYSYATWRVKPGNEAAFIAAWQAFADWTTGEQAGAGVGILLQEETDSQNFVSLGPWESAAAADRWRAQPQFQAFIAEARVLCETVKPRNMKLVGRSRT